LLSLLARRRLNTALGSMSDYIEPTTQSRIRVIAAYAFAALVYIAVRLAWDPFFAQISARPICDQVPWWRGVIVFFACLFCWLAFLQFRAAYHIAQQLQFPSADAKVFFRTKVAKGHQALLLHAVPLVLIGATILAVLTYLLLTDPVRAIFSAVPECAGA